MLRWRVKELAAAKGVREEQDTMPLPVIRRGLPTVRQLRLWYRMEYADVAQAAGVPMRVAYWIEQGIAVAPIDALKILTVFSARAGYPYTFDNVQGIRFKAP